MSIACADINTISVYDAVALNAQTHDHLGYGAPRPASVLYAQLDDIARALTAANQESREPELEAVVVVVMYLAPVNQ